MANLAKKFHKSAKRLSKQLDCERGLTIGHSHTCTTSLYRGKKSSKPYMTVSVSGNYKISVLKLILWVLCVIFSVVLVSRLVCTVKGAKSKRKCRKNRTVCDHGNFADSVEISL